MSEWLMWPIAMLALLGVHLNGDKIRWCWPLWMMTNATTCLHLVLCRDWPLAAKQAAFFCMSVRGWYRWERDRIRRRDNDGETS